MKSYYDIAGDGGSEVIGQVVAKRDRIRQKLAGVRWRVAVGSGKGGVGKSTLTFHLASALADAGQHVAILDADLNGPTQARLAGLRDAVLVPHEGGVVPPRGAGGVGVVSLGSLVPETESLEFASVAAGDSHTWRATREFTLLGELLESVDWGTLDVLLVDLPPGAERAYQYAEFLGAETAFVIVGLPSELARGVVSRSVAALRKTPNRLLGYIENMQGYYCEDCNELRPLFPDPDRGVPDLTHLGSIPFDPQLALACDRGERWDPNSKRPAVQALRDIARRLVESLERVP